MVVLMFFFLGVSEDFHLRLCISIRRRKHSGKELSWKPIGTSRVQGESLQWLDCLTVSLTTSLPRRGAWPVYDARYILRPETVESIFLAYRLTGDSRYRDIGWKIFKSIEKHCRLEGGGYASVLNVDDTHSQKDDKMETFWLVCFSSFDYLFGTSSRGRCRAKRSSICISCLRMKV